MSVLSLRADRDDSILWAFLAEDLLSAEEEPVTFPPPPRVPAFAALTVLPPAKRVAS